MRVKDDPGERGVRFSAAESIRNGAGTTLIRVPPAEELLNQYSRTALSNCQVRRISITSYWRDSPGGKAGYGA